LKAAKSKSLVILQLVSVRITKGFIAGKLPEFCLRKDLEITL
jgi:hypothetical protein